MIRLGRRHFLMGAGGLMYALPALEGLAPKAARADVSNDGFLMIYSQPMGVCQDVGGRLETFWPNFGSGPIDASKLAAAEAAGRTLGMLKDFAGDVAIVRGIKHLTDGEGHEVGKAQVLTGSGFHFNDPADHHSAVALSEDIACRYARELCGGSLLNTAGHYMGDPVGTYVWTMGKIPEDMTFNPSHVFNKIFSSPVAADVVAARRSVNDTVLVELSSLRNSAKISSRDRQRLDLHAESIRLIEKRLSCNSPPAGLLARATEIGTDPRQFDTLTIEEMHKMMLSMIATGISCGAIRSVHFHGRGGARGQNSDMFAAGSNEFEHGLPQELHEYSHRVGAPGEAYDTWKERLPRLDRWHQRRFTEFLSQLKEYGVLDKGISVFHSEVATGGHEQYNIPFVIAGSAGGRIKTGQYIDVGAPTDNGYGGAGVSNNKLLATVGAALGLRDNGVPITQFGGIREGGAPEPAGYVDALKGSSFPG